MPRFRSSPQKREAPTQAAGIVAQMAAAGLPLKLEEVYRKIGFSMPSDDDEIFEGHPQEEAPGGLPFTAAEVSA